MSAVLERTISASQDRGALAKMVMTLLEHWKLSTEDQAALLGLAASNRAALTRYRKGEAIGSSRDQRWVPMTAPPEAGVLEVSATAGSFPKSLPLYGSSFHNTEHTDRRL